MICKEKPTLILPQQRASLTQLSWSLSPYTAESAWGAAGKSWWSMIRIRVHTWDLASILEVIQTCLMDTPFLQNVTVFPVAYLFSFFSVEAKCITYGFIWARSLSFVLRIFASISFLPPFLMEMGTKKEEYIVTEILNILICN